MRETRFDSRVTSRHGVTFRERVTKPSSKEACFIFEKRCMKKKIVSFRKTSNLDPNEKDGADDAQDATGTQNFAS